MFRLDLGPTQPPVQWVPRVLSPGVKRGRSVTLTTHPNLVSRSWMSSVSMACSETALLLPHPHSCFIIIDFDIILLPISRSQKWRFVLNCVKIYPVSHTCYMLRPTNILYAPLIISGEEQKLWRSWLCSFFCPCATFSLKVPNNILSSLFSNSGTLSVHPSLRFSD
jgi:hypothetical protein